MGTVVESPVTGLPGSEDALPASPSRLTVQCVATEMSPLPTQFDVPSCRGGHSRSSHLPFFVSELVSTQVGICDTCICHSWPLPSFANLYLGCQVTHAFAHIHWCAGSVAASVHSDRNNPWCPDAAGPILFILVRIRTCAQRLIAKCSLQVLSMSAAEVSRQPAKVSPLATARQVSWERFVSLAISC